MNKKLTITPTEYQFKVRKQAKARTIKFREQQKQRGYKNLTIYLSKPFRSELKRLSSEKGLNRQSAMDHIFDIYQQATGNSDIMDTVTSNAKDQTDKTNNVTSNAIKTESKTTENTGNIDLDKVSPEYRDVLTRISDSVNDTLEHALSVVIGSYIRNGLDVPMPKIKPITAPDHHELEFEPDQDTGKAATTTATESTPDHLDTCTPATVTDTGTPETATDQAPDTGKADTTTDTGKKQAPDQAMVKGYPNRQLELEIDQQADATPATENKTVMVREFNKDEICKVIVELKDVQGLGYTAISRELYSLGYRPKSKNKDHFHHSTVAKYYKDGKKALQ